MTKNNSWAPVWRFLFILMTIWWLLAIFSCPCKAQTPQSKPDSIQRAQQDSILKVLTRLSINETVIDSAFSRAKRILTYADYLDKEQYLIWFANVLRQVWLDEEERKKKK